MRIVWMPAAKRDRIEITDHIARDNPTAALRMDELFESAVQRLSRFPKLGRPGLFPGTRELIPHRNYRLVYRVGEETVWILALFHTARQWPSPVRRTDR